MRKVKDENIRLADIKFTENSRLRGKDDVSDLMHDIEQHGLLEPIGVRVSDNSIMFGNRRVKAYDKLGYKEIQCQFFADVTDEDLLILNVVENIKRKSIGSIEIGRMCQLLEKKGMTKSEIAIRLAIKRDRVRSSIAAYNVTRGTPFENLIVHGVFGKQSARKNIPETVIWKIQTTLSRAFPSNVITKEHWKILLPAIESGDITTKNVYTLRSILIQDPEKDLVKALDILGKVKVLNAFIPFVDAELRRNMAKVKIESMTEFLRHIIKLYNEKLLF